MSEPTFKRIVIRKKEIECKYLVRTSFVKVLLTRARDGMDNVYVFVTYITTTLNFKDVHRTYTTYIRGTVFQAI